MMYTSKESYISSSLSSIVDRLVNKSQSGKMMLSPPIEESEASNRTALGYVVKVGEAVLDLADSFASRLNEKTKPENEPELSTQEMTEYLMKDSKLWNEFQKELADSKVVTNLGVREVLNMFLAENRRKIELQQRNTAKQAAGTDAIERSYDLSSASHVSLGSAGIPPRRLRNLFHSGLTKPTSKKPCKMFNKSQQNMAFDAYSHSSNESRSNSEVRPIISTKNTFQLNTKQALEEMPSSLAPKMDSNRVNSLLIKFPSSSPPTNMRSFVECGKRKSGLAEDFGKSNIRSSLKEVQTKEVKDIGSQANDPKERDISISSMQKISDLQRKLIKSPIIETATKEKQRRAFYDSQFHFNHKPCDWSKSRDFLAVTKEKTKNDIFWV